MRYGFVIDNTRCIGCHACSTACKSENEVPLGVYRTWVKYVETGVYPDARRHFQVTRCNHCENPPCVRICPVSAMIQRADGIVEVDGDRCIGCKACLQACPYDAVHIDPETQTAAKCHYCAHRVDVGLEPACVVVCPTQAIVAGDLDEPRSRISTLLGRQKTTVRRPEQGTGPKLFYIDGLAASLHPTAARPGDGGFLWADADEARVEALPPLPPLRDAPQGLPQQAVPLRSGRAAEQMVQVAYNVQHEVPWHWPVPAYLVTKAVAAGSLLLLAAAGLLGVTISGTLALVTALASLGFAGATTALLVADLEKPARFLRVLTRPQWGSWLTRGAFILVAFSLAATLFAALEAGVRWGFVGPALATRARPWLLGALVPLAIGAAIYTGFLFAQAEGRDLWQSPLLPIHLLVQAAMMGAATLLVISLALGDAPWVGLSRAVFAVTLLVDLAMLLWGELGVAHASDSAARAAHEIAAGRYRRQFWLGAVVLGHGVPLALLLRASNSAAAVAAAAAAAVGLYLYEHAFVMAPQHVPNS